MIPDAAARSAAIDPRRSLVVQAPAGSGKTALLIQRYLALLALVEAPEEILALTFTRKAAEEMQERVLAALLSAEGAPCEDAYERETQMLARAAMRQAQARGWFLIDCPSRLRIQTFDAFCAQIVNQYPAAAGVGVSLETSLAPEALYAEAAMATFGLLDQDDAVAHALAQLLPALGNDIDRFVTLVCDLLARREQWLPMVLQTGSDDGEAARARLEAVLFGQAQIAVRRARALCPDNVLIALCSYMEALTGDDTWHPAVLSRHDNEALSRWQELAGRLLTAKGDMRKRLTGWPKGLGPAGEFAALLEGLEGFAQALGDVAAFGSCRYGDEPWARLSALIRILPAASAQLLLIFARHGQWDFTEVALRALQALGSGDEPTEGALRLDRRLRHILVDEFQDTSVLQYRLLEQLTAGWMPGEARSLFVVGDPMQSIYAFRKAEVGLFFKLGREGVGAWSLEMLALEANFRSDEGLVTWVNEAFAAILPTQFDADQGAVPHIPARAVRTGAGEVHVHGLEAMDMDREASYVARLVAELRAQGPSLRMAILVRTRGHGHAIAEALTRAGIRFQAQDLYSLGARPVILDLLALTETLLLPAGRLSALSLLRAPWCGLDLRDVALVCEGDERLLVDILCDESRMAPLSVEGRASVHRLRDCLVEAEVSRARVPLVSRVERAWKALGGPAALEAPAELREAELFFRGLAELEVAGEVDVWALREHLMGLYAPPDPDGGDLHILTIHKAKGLEFDVVICPGLGRESRAERYPLLLTSDITSEGEAQFLLAPLKAHDEDKDPIYECLWRFATRKRRHEVGRLLYVACTRARYGLHLVGHAKRKGEELRPGGLLSVLWPVIEADFLRSLQDGGPGAAAANPSTRGLRRLARAGVLEEPMADAPLDRAPESDPPIVFDWAGTCIREAGVVVHALLADLAESTPPLESGLPLDVARRAERLLRGYGLDGKDWELAYGIVVEALEKTLADPRGRWILQPHNEARCEYPLTTFKEEGLLTFRVDRTFVDDKGVRWIIDYKTSRHEGADREGFIQRELDRYGPQLTQYGQLFQSIDERPVELALYFPLLAAFHHWRYESQ